MAPNNWEVVAHINNSEWRRNLRPIVCSRHPETGVTRADFELMPPPTDITLIIGKEPHYVRGSSLAPATTATANTPTSVPFACRTLTEPLTIPQAPPAHLMMRRTKVGVKEAKAAKAAKAAKVAKGEKARAARVANHGSID